MFLQGYFYNVDSFNFNFAQAKAITGNYQEAEEMFLLINSETLKSDYVYISWLARCCMFHMCLKIAQCCLCMWQTIVIMNNTQYMYIQIS